MSQQLQITGGAKVRDLNDVIIGTSGVLSSLAFNVANGVPKLDVNGKILVSQLPNSVMEYLGTWDASTNTPTLVNGTGNQGDVYLCNVAGTVNFGAGPITFAVGDSAIYSGTIWQKAGGATGTVTSVGLTSTGNDAITITGSPITTSGNINLGFAGTNLQYINGAGDLTTFPTLISSIGLTMPSAFSVANSPLTANGTIAVTGAGYPSQYIRGDGTLADFPTSGGGGSSVSYYLNGGTSQGTIGGVTYYEMSKTADTGTGVDFNKTGDGLIVSFLTDAGDPAQLNIPAGNWNYEIYASMSANGGTPEMYAELYKYDGTTFTLISTSSNEILYDGTNLNLYTFAMTVPATILTLTDRLAIKLYATNSGGKTTTVHTQDSHLCQVITTFSTGITALNGLTAQVQYFATGTSGTDFNISSTTATHTFNIPSASATNRGLITTGSQTIAGDKAFTGINSFDYGINYKTGASLANVSGYISQAYATSGTGAGSTLSLKISDGNSVKAINLDFVGSPATYTYTFPAASGTIALTSNLSSYVPYTGATTDVNLGIYNLSGRNLIANGTSTFSGLVQLKQSGGGIGATSGYLTMASLSSGKLNIYFGDAGGNGIELDNNLLTSVQGYSFPNATGTFALLQATQVFSGSNTFSGLNQFTFSSGTAMVYGPYLTKGAVPTVFSGSTTNIYSDATTNNIVIRDNSSIAKLVFNNSTQTYTFPAATGTIALTTDLGSYVPLAGNVNVTGPLGINTTGGAGTTGLTNFGTFITRSDSTQGFPRKLAISMASGTLVSIDASGNGANYITDMAFSTSTASGLNGTPAIYITGTNNRVGIKTGTPAYDLDVSGTGRFTGAITGGSSITATGNIRSSNAGGTIYTELTSDGVYATGTNLYLLAPATKDMVLYANDTERVRIKSGGSVLIGSNTAPSAIGVNDLLVLGKSGSASNAINFSNGSTTNWAYILAESAKMVLGTGSSSSIAFETNAGSERMRITSAGNVGIGTTTPSYKLDVVSLGSPSARVRNGDLGGTATLLLETANNFSGTCQTYIQCIGSTGTGLSNLAFGTAGASGDSTATERMRIASGGEVSIYGDLYIGGQGYKPGGGSWANSSDIRLKENVKTIENALDKVMQLRGVTFDWKQGYTENGKKESGGFIADEVMEVFPDWVSETNTTEAQKEIVNDEKIKSLSLPFSFDALLVEAIKELSQQNQDLKSRLDKAGL